LKTEVRSHILSRFKEHSRTRKVVGVKRVDDMVEVEFEGKVVLRLNQAEAEAVKVKDVVTA
jgi:hypothetical protein